MTDIWFIIGLDILMIPFITVADWFLLEKNLSYAIGKKVPIHFFFWPTFLELMCFNLGILAGAGWSL